MGYYDWPTIFKNRTQSELRSIIRNSDSETEEKVLAARNELINRGCSVDDFSKVLSQNNQIEINDFSVCYFCKTKGLSETDKFCPICGFPQRGTKSEMYTFIGNIHKKRSLLEKHKRAISKARLILFILAGINILIGFLLGFVEGINVPMIIGGIIGSIIYLSLGLWSKKQPFPAILMGLIIYLFINVLNAVFDPHTIYQGILWKVIIISGFVYGYKGAKESKNLEKELLSLEEAKDISSDQ